MDTITFAYRAGDDEIVIEINGRSLRDLARAVELPARIEVADSDVTWSGFRQGHRDWDLGDLGPFHFGRAAYERAVAELATGLARARP